MYGSPDEGKSGVGLLGNGTYVGIRLLLAPEVLLAAGTVELAGAAGAHASRSAGATSAPTARLVRSMN